MKWENDTQLACIIDDNVCSYFNKKYDDMTEEELDISDHLESEIEEKFPDYPDYYDQQSKIILDVFTDEVIKKGIVHKSNEEVDNFVKDFVEKERGQE